VPVSDDICQLISTFFVYQCLKETHKLHIGSPVHDNAANGAVIVGCHKKAYLICDSDAKEGTIPRAAVDRIMGT